MKTVAHLAFVWLLECQASQVQSRILCAVNACHCAAKEISEWQGSSALAHFTRRSTELVITCVLEFRYGSTSDKWSDLNHEFKTKQWSRTLQSWPEKIVCRNTMIWPFREMIVWMVSTTKICHSDKLQHGRMTSGRYTDRHKVLKEKILCLLFLHAAGHCTCRFNAKVFQQSWDASLLCWGCQSTTQHCLMFLFTSGKVGLCLS